MTSNSSDKNETAQARTQADDDDAMDTTATITNRLDSRTTGRDPAPVATTTIAENLPLNRFELELEFVQALASPNYLHFLATNPVEQDAVDAATTTTTTTITTVLQDPAFIAFLKYLRNTWSHPDYNRFLSFPHCLYFLDLLIEKPAVVLKEWTLPAFRNFCHQQQFLCWQHRHAVTYGRGVVVPQGNERAAAADEIAAVSAGTPEAGLSTSDPSQQGALPG